MICVQLSGGLGNQMFQYAFGRALAAKHHTELILDCTIFQDKTPRLDYTLRDYELDVLAINARQASKDELNRCWPSFFCKIYRSLRRRCGLPEIVNPAYLVEQQLPYSLLAIDQAASDCYLIGFWQSEQFFKSVESLVRQEFTFKHPLDTKNSEIAKRISSVNSVSLHVRRGDYVNNPQITNSHGLCSLEYYQNAISSIEKNITNPVFFIFSDDIEWVRANLVLSGQSEIVSGNTGIQSYIDMQLMCLCRHNIIANSSFSWWGAWLNNNTDKIVVAPKQWFPDEAKNVQTKDLIPEKWIRL